GPSSAFLTGLNLRRSRTTRGAGRTRLRAVGGTAPHPDVSEDQPALFAPEPPVPFHFLEEPAQLLGRDRDHLGDLAVLEGRLQLHLPGPAARGRRQSAQG